MSLALGLSIVLVFFTTVGGFAGCIQLNDYRKKPGIKPSIIALCSFLGSLVFAIIAVSIATLNGLPILIIVAIMVLMAILFIAIAIILLTSSDSQASSYSQVPGAVWYDIKFNKKPKKWPDHDVWKVINGRFSSRPTTPNFSEFIIPRMCPHADYALEVTAQIESSNQGRPEFGIAIHCDGSDSGGYQGVIAPDGVFVKVDGPNTPPKYCPYYPGDRFVIYRIEVHSSVVRFYADGEPCSPLAGITATQYLQPGRAVIWIWGGAMVNIKRIRIMAT